MKEIQKMNFVKKNLKWIITIIGVIIVTTGISVYATGQYLASQVDYNKNGKAKVSDALDDLYNKQTTTISNLSNQVNDLTTQLSSITNAGAHGDFTTTDTTTIHTVTIGFRPSKLFFIVPNSNAGAYEVFCYDSTVTSNYLKCFWGTDSNSTSVDMRDTGGGTRTLSLFGLTILDDGFTYKSPGTYDMGKTYWYAIK